MASLATRIAYEMVDDYPQAAGYPVAATHGPGCPVAVQALIAPGAVLTDDPNSWPWADITPYVRWNEGISVTKGKAEWSSTANAGRGGLYLDNRDGRFSRKNPMSPYYGLLTRSTPIWVRVDPGTGTYDLMTMYVNEWPKEMDQSATDHGIPLIASGPLRRIIEGRRKLDSPIRRRIVELDPAAYWACEEGQYAAGCAQLVTGGGSDLVAPDTATGAAPVGSSKVSFGSGTGTAGSDGIAGIAQNAYMHADIANPGTAASWRLDLITQVPVIPPDSTDVAVIGQFGLGGSAGSWAYLQIDSGGGVVAADNTNGRLRVAAVLADFSGFNEYVFDQRIADGRAHHISIRAEQTGGTVTWTAYVDGVSDSVVSSTKTLSPIVEVYAGLYGANPWVQSIGHIAYWSPMITDDTYAAASGYASEYASDRITRICGIASISVTVEPGPSEAMGPEPRAPIFDILDDTAKTDAGILYERGFGLGFIPRSAVGNAPPVMTLDFSQGDLAEQPKPTDDTQQLLNKVTASRPGGESRTYADQASVDENGERERSLDFNVAAVGQLDGAAQWAVHLGTFDDYRWPILAVNLSSERGRTLIPAWVQLGVGSMVELVNPPYQIQSDSVLGLVEEIEQMFRPQLWTGRLTTSPGTPWDILTIDAAPGPANLGRLGLNHGLLTGIDEDDTALSVSPVSGPLLTTTATFPGDFPYDIMIGGERMTVTATTGSSAPQTVTVTRSVNGVVKSHAADSLLSLYRPGVIGR